MAESFINQVKRTSSIKTYEYEDFLIKGEVKNAKNMITKAIKVQKSHITWCYAHDDYDNFTSLRNDIDEPYPYTKNSKTISPTLELAVIVTLILKWQQYWQMAI